MGSDQSRTGFTVEHQQWLAGISKHLPLVCSLSPIWRKTFESYPYVICCTSNNGSRRYVSKLLTSYFPAAADYRMLNYTFIIKRLTGRIGTADDIDFINAMIFCAASG